MKNKIKIHNVEQMSDEWFKLRAGKMTASHGQEIGNNGKGLESYILKLMSEYYANVSEENYTNTEMERGVELEKLARGKYEMEKGMRVNEVGFIELNEFVGCSPDGLVEKDGGLEIKCHNNLNHFKLILNCENGIESKYIWQIQMNLMITGRKWWDYVAYNPNFERDLLVFRIKPDKEKFKKLQEGIKIGTSKIKDIMKKWVK